MPGCKYCRNGLELAIFNLGWLPGLRFRGGGRQGRFPSNAGAYVLLLTEWSSQDDGTAAPGAFGPRRRRKGNLDVPRSAAVVNVEYREIGFATLRGIFIRHEGSVTQLNVSCKR